MVIYINTKGLRIWLLVLMMLHVSVVTSQRNQLLMNAVRGKRFDVAPRDVIAHISGTRCTVACLAASWCVSVNLFSDDGTCQLLSEEASNETSLETVNGWKYFCEFAVSNSFLVSYLVMAKTASIKTKQI